MARYIDADELSRRMYHDAFETDSDMQRWDSGCWIRYKMFENAINDAPTADVRENVKGQWLRHECDEDGLQDGWQCSACNEWFYFGEFKPNFCPNCGADMRGKQDDTR